MTLAFPGFFVAFVPAMQAAGHEVSILTGRPASDNEANLAMLEQLGITPDVFVGKPDQLTIDDDTFKAIARRDLEIDVLFDCPPPLRATNRGARRIYSDASLLLIALLGTLWRLSYHDM